MRTKITLVLIFLNVALFFFIFKFERQWRTESASLEARRRVLGAEAANIQRLEINRTAGGAFKLVRNRDNWFLTEPLDWPANPHAVNSIVQELVLLEHETSFRVADLTKTNQSLADYGLANPKITVAFASGGPTGTEATPPNTVLRIGDLTKDGKRLYVLSTDGERVHVVGRTLIETLNFTLDQLRADTLLTIQVFEARSLVVQTANPDQSRGSIATNPRTRIRREAARWNFDAPIGARASKTAVDLAINELNALKPKSIKPAGPPAPAGSTPELRITLEGNNRSETLLLREPVVPAEGAPGVGPANIEYHAGLEGRASQFTVVVPVTLLDALRNAQEKLREKRILDELDTQAVTSITLAAPLLSSPALTLQKLDATAGAGPDTAPQWLIQRAGSGQSPQPVPADRAAVQRLLDRLALLAAERFTSDAPTSADLEEWGFNRPEREITLTVAGNRLPIVLRLGTDANPPRNVYARVGTQTDHGPSVYNVNLDIRRELPIEINDWRDRTLRAPLPPGARFTSLKITDLTSKQVVFETAINAAGEPAISPRDPKALQSILAQLRTLRAKTILPGGFSDRVPLGGEERPWRYQLDYTVALPGGGGTETSSPPLALFLTDRLGGAQQYAGSRDLDVIFEIEQPLLDAFWSIVARDPGPPGGNQAKE